MPTPRRNPLSLRQAFDQLMRLDRALRLVWKSAPGWMSVNILLVFAEGLLPLAGLYLLRQVINVVTNIATTSGGGTAGLNDFQPVLGWLGLAAGVGILSAIVRALGELASQTQAYLVTDHVSDLLHAQSIAVDLGYYEDARYYDTLHRAQAEAPYRPTSIVNGLVGLAQNAVSLAGVVGLFLTLSPLVSLVMFLAAFPGAIVRLFYARKLFRFEQEQAEAERWSWYYHWLLTSSEYAKEVRIFGLGGLFKNRYRQVRNRLRQGRLNITRQRSMANGLVQIVATLAIFSTLGFAAFQAIQGKISIGDLVAVYMGFQIGLTSLVSMMRSLAGLYEDNLFLSHFYQFLDMQPSVKGERPLSGPTNQAVVRFEEVSFTYPNQREAALSQVSLRLKPGEVIALVGANGSGKTTLVKLLCRLYDPTAGKITIDGVDLRTLDPVAWRSQLSVIFQDFAHYQLSVFENIWLGNIAAAPEEESVAQAVHRAAAQSGAEAVVQRLPHGYDTHLGAWFSEGSEISLGEWQKVALARAFMRPSGIIILDEPTSALDPLAEAELFQQFRKLIGKNSAILISHRFSTVQMADTIYVMDGGKVVEQGSHTELLARHGRYATLYQAQAQYYQISSKIGPTEDQ